jgi:hypothetical protein
MSRARTFESVLKKKRIECFPKTENDIRDASLIKTESRSSSLTKKFPHPGIEPGSPVYIEPQREA